MRKSTGGFTIVEIIIVVVVIAILATISIVAYGEVQKRIYNAAVDSALYQAEKAIRSFDVMTVNDRYKLLDPNDDGTQINGALSKLKLYESAPITTGGVGAPLKGRVVEIHWCGGSKYLMYASAYEGVDRGYINEKILRCRRPHLLPNSIKVTMVAPDDPLFKYKEIDLSN